MGGWVEWVEWVGGVGGWVGKQAALELGDLAQPAGGGGLTPGRPPTGHLLGGPCPGIQEHPTSLLSAFFFCVGDLVVSERCGLDLLQVQFGAGLSGSATSGGKRA